MQPRENPRCSKTYQGFLVDKMTTDDLDIFSILFRRIWRFPRGESGVYELAAENFGSGWCGSWLPAPWPLASPQRLWRVACHTLVWRQRSHERESVGVRGSEAAHAQERVRHCVDTARGQSTMTEGQSSLSESQSPPPRGCRLASTGRIYRLCHRSWNIVGLTYRSLRCSTHFAARFSRRRRLG